MPTVEDAIALARRSHSGQVDKAGEAYISHPLRVMAAMETEDERMVAVLHDVVEDTDVTVADLVNAGYPDAVVQAVALLTKPEHEDYFDYVRRVGQNPLARKVKLADLRDNMNLERIAQPTEKDHRRLERYRQALQVLGEAETS